MNPEQVRRTEAITRLAVATRERLDRQVLDVYLEDVKHWSTPVLVEACRRLHHGEFFPKVGEVLKACASVADEFYRAECAERERKWLAQQPVKTFDPEAEQRRKDRMAKFLADCKAEVARKSMK